MRKRIYLFSVLLMAALCAYTQASNIGTPPVLNFYKKDYKGSPQNWDIAQNKQGLLYFANSEGLLEFDGIHWQCYRVSNQTNVRSVAIAEDGKIYVGAQGDLGYFSGDETGVLTYHSLRDLLPEQDRFFADVWDIEIVGDQVFFGTGNAVFLYQEEELSIIYNAARAINHLAQTDDQLFVHDADKGLLRYEEGTFRPLLTSPYFSDQMIHGLHSFGTDTLLITTQDNGLFLLSDNQVTPWRINDNDILRRNRVSCAAKLGATNFAFGTSAQGVFIVNKQGQITRHINNEVGLQGNAVLCLSIDRSNNLWAGLDNGIDLIETNSPFTNIFPNRDLKSMGYAIQIHNDQIYFGTANGVYASEWKSYYNPSIATPYRFVTNSNGQVWDLSVHGGDLLLNHHEGTYIIKEDAATKIPSQSGSWIQLPVSPDKFLSGHYNGLLLLEKEEGWRMTADFQNDWRESCRIMVQDEQGYIWVSHPYHGLFKVQFNDDFSTLENVRSYNADDGFPSALQIYVFKIGEEVVFCAEQGVYTYDASNDRFEPNEKWNNLFGEQERVHRLIEAPNGDIWFVTDSEVGLLEVSDAGIYKNINKRVLPQLNNKLVKDFEEIYPYNEENVFIAHETGFIHYNPQQTTVDTHFNALIRQIQLINNDSLLFGGHAHADQQIPLIDYQNNDLHIAFSATYFGSFEKNKFQYYLEGYDEPWGSWTETSQKEYTNLNAGTYAFRVRAKNVHGHLSDVATYTFRILPPWYTSKLALISYVLLFGGVLFALIFIPQKRFEREKASMQSEQEKTLLQKEEHHELLKKQSQQQITQLEKEKLELEIQSKNQELASNTMHLLQKSEILLKVKEDIQKIARSAKDKAIAKQLNTVIRKLSEDERLDEDWEQFAQYFDQVYNDFLQRLQSTYPQLSPKDHRLCAYLRINLSSKEIASLMNISVRSVEMARYRLRKKLSIDGDVNLVEFMMQI